jgi:hypothetical protein
MMRLAPPLRAWLGTAALLGLLAGCGGESSVSVGVPTENNGPIISGQVSMPNGRVAAAPSALERVAAGLVARVEALVAPNVAPVPAGIVIRLRRIDASNIRNGAIVGGEVVNEATTGSNGTFSLRMPTGTDPGTCRFLLEVGNAGDRTLTRAFVDADGVDIDFESEATVRLLLQEINADHVRLCDLDAGEIFRLRSTIQESQNQAFGETAAAINSSATAAAAADPSVQASLSQATGRITPSPVPATATATVPVPPTNTVPPAATNTPVPTRTSTRVPTNTSAPTNTSVPTRTDTPMPTRTNTATVAPTNTTAPTNTSAPTNTATPVPTNTSAPTNTATAAPTNTPVPTNTATVPPTPTATAAVPQINLGVVAGTAGFAVDLPATLVSGGAQVAAVSSDIEFDSAALSVVTDGGAPDCRVDARLTGLKDAVASVADLGGGRGRLRVGIVGLDNNAVISNGPLFTCRFLIAPGATGSSVLLNTPEAAGQQGQLIAADGSDGRIDVSAAPAALGLSAGTAAAAEPAEVAATLIPRGQSLAAVATDIRFDPARLRAGDPPDCTLTAAVTGKELVSTILPDDDQGRAGIRVGVFGRTNNAALPAGALFTCRFLVESAGPPIALEHTAEGAAPSAQPVALLGEPGTITVP